MYDKLVYALVPSGYKANKLYSFVGGDMTFSRATTATRINKDGYIELVPTGVPRLNYPLVNGVPSIIPELLLEPARINYLTYSEDFSNAIWQKLSGGTGVAPIVTSNYSISPDGNKTADRIKLNRGSGATVSDISYINYPLALGTIDACFSVYLKTNDNTTKDVTLRLGVTLFDYNITVTPNWQRFVVKGNSNIDRAQILLYGNQNEQTADLSCWGAQVESGSYETSYIPTFDSTASRNAESNLGSNSDFNSTEGVLFIEIAPLADDNTFRTISISDGSSSNRVNIYYSTTSKRISASLFISGVISGGINYDATNNYFDYLKIAYKYKKDDFALWVNGIEIGSVSSGNVLPAEILDVLNFTSGSTSNPFYGRVRQVLIFNEALTDSELETLTS